jgi:hypothetical protein
MASLDAGHFDKLKTVMACLKFSVMGCCFSPVFCFYPFPLCVFTRGKNYQHPLPTKRKLYNLRNHRVRVNDEIRQYRPDDPSSSAAVLPQPEVAAIPVKVANFFGEGD